MSTQTVREIGELVRKTHHVDPLTERNDSTNDVIKRITLKNKVGQWGTGSRSTTTRGAKLKSQC
jgi:hypothetical protein